RPSVSVRARRAYAIESDESRIQDKIEATLLTNTAYADLTPTLRIEPSTREKGDYLLPVQVDVPVRDVIFSTDGERATARLAFYLGSIDDRGGRWPVSRVSQNFTIPAAETRSPRSVSERFSLRMKKGNYRIVVNVRDLESGRIGTARANVHVD